MTKRILLTSFDVWLPHHQSNSSDDLLIEISKHNSLPHSFTFLRRLPVDVRLASDRVISHIEKLQPDGIICCGMAERRTQLTVESHATWEQEAIKTSVNLDKLVMGLAGTGISHDAGKFVCEGLYYSVLRYLRDRNLKRPCIFVHVPTLTPDNLPAIRADFSLIIQRLHVS